MDSRHRHHRHRRLRLLPRSKLVLRLLRNSWCPLLLRTPSYYDDVSLGLVATTLQKPTKKADAVANDKRSVFKTWTASETWVE